MQEYNAQPQAELGGLSPVQMSHLLAGDWTSTGALRVADDVPPELLRDVPFLADARTVLHYVADHAPLPLTKLGNLPRSVVAALVPPLRMLEEEREMLRQIDREIRNEGDAQWLVILRHILLFAKLLVRRKGLVLSKRGHELLDDARVGVLYALLFRTFFQRFDLRYLGSDDRHPGLQPTIAWSFYQLRKDGTDWTSAEALAERAWLDSARDPMSTLDIELGDMRHYAFERRVLKPLVMFGLMESRQLPGAERWEFRREYRRVALFERVLRVAFTGDARGDLFLMR
jgi:hypothetical protein